MKYISSAPGMIRDENDVRRANKAADDEAENCSVDLGRLATTHDPKRATFAALLLHPVQQCVHLSPDLLAEVANFSEAKTACALPLQRRGYLAEYHDSDYNADRVGHKGKSRVSLSVVIFQPSLVDLWQMH